MAHNERLGFPTSYLNFAAYLRCLPFYTFKKYFFFNLDFLVMLAVKHFPRVFIGQLYVYFCQLMYVTQLYIELLICFLSLDK